MPEVQFRLEQIAIGVERIELGIHTAGVLRIRQAFPIFKSRDLRFLRCSSGLASPLAISTISDRLRFPHTWSADAVVLFLL